MIPVEDDVGAEFFRFGGGAADRLVISVLWLQLHAHADGLRCRCHGFPAYREAVFVLLAVDLAVIHGRRPAVAGPHPDDPDLLLADIAALRDQPARVIAFV